MTTVWNKEKVDGGHAGKFKDIFKIRKNLREKIKLTDIV